MALSERVFTAILAMDAHNRDRFDTDPRKYLAGVTVTGDIGLASFRALTDRRDIGFQATYYHWNGKKVIAYRGTDEAPWTNGTSNVDIYAYVSVLGIPTGQTRA
jgi:hypothetical protein